MKRPSPLAKIALATILTIPGVSIALTGFETPLAVATRLSKEYRSALLARDADRIEKSGTADFMYVDVKGRKLSRADAMAAMRGGLKAMTAVRRVDVKVLSAQRGEGGVVYVSQTKMLATINVGGPKPSTLESTMRNEWLAVPASGGWLIKRIRVLKEETKIDGKPMPGA